jgi:hypothetical protein
MREGVPATFRIGGKVYQRLRYGEEAEDWGADRQPCHDCGVIKGELHIFGFRGFGHDHLSRGCRGSNFRRMPRPKKASLVALTRST